MKKNTPMIIAYSVLAALTVVMLILNFSVSQAIVAAAVLGVVAVAFFTGKNRSLVGQLPWFVFGILFSVVVLPALPHANLRYGLERFFEAFGDSCSESLFIIVLVLSAALMLFFRDKPGLFFMIARYVCFFLLLAILGNNLFRFGSFETTLPVLLGTTLLCLAYEIRGRQMGLFRKRTTCMLLSNLAYYLVHTIFGEGVSSIIVSIFRMGNVGWLVPTLAVAVIGFLLIMEEYNNRERFGDEDEVDGKLGWVLLFWSLTSLIMHIWTATLDYVALIVLPAVFYLLYCSLFTDEDELLEFEEKHVFPVAWGVFSFVMLVVGKSLNQTPLVAIAIMVLLVAAYILWRIVHENENGPLIMKGFLGIAAAALLASTLIPGETDPVGISKILVSAVLGGVSWCLLCGNMAKVDEKASKIYRKEYTAVVKLSVIAPLAILLVALVRILFVM